MNNKVKCALALVIFIILTILGYVLFPKNEVVVEDKEIEDYIYVHVEGCVNEPGLIKVKYGTRIYEVIEEAGGETYEADLSRVNLATIVSDEQKIVIPAKIEFEEEAEDNEESGLVNINTASKEKLMSLNGVGESTAQKIIDYREDNGYFNSVEDIMNVSGIGESKFNKIKEYITT